MLFRIAKMLIKHPFEKDQHLLPLGYVLSIAGPYLTMIHSTPCLAAVMSTMEAHGYDLIVQPVKHAPKDIFPTNSSYVATWRLRDVPTLSLEYLKS